MSTHNICFCGEIRKIFCGYSGAMFILTDMPLTANNVELKEYSA